MVGNSASTGAGGTIADTVGIVTGEKVYAGNVETGSLVKGEIISDGDKKSDI